MAIKKRIIAAGLAAVFSGSSLYLPVFAASNNPFTWDGTTPPAENHTYYIEEPVTVNGSFTLPASSNMYILPGGSLNVTQGSSLTTEGLLSVENGGSAIVRGRLTVRGDMTVYGLLAAYNTSSIGLYGKMNCEDNSSLSLQGDTNFYAGSLFSSGGYTHFSGNTTLDNTAYFPDGEFFVDGELTFGNQSVVNVDCDFTINKKGKATNNGSLTLDENCVFRVEGLYTNGGDVIVTDNRKPYDDKALSLENMLLHTGVELDGIDVSYAQGDIDWVEVAASGMVDFAIIRSSRGRLNDNNLVTNDSYFHQNALGAMQNNIPFGVYHYCYAENVEQAREEAKFVISLIRNYDVSYPVVFDIEDPWYINNGYTKAELTAMTQVFCEEIKNAGYVPMVYSYASFLAYYLDMEQLKDYPVWVAHVDTDSPAYDDPYFLWQYSWKGSVPGINGDVDLDKGYIDFEAYTKEFNLNNR